MDRIAAPMEEAMNCPITAKLTSRMTAITSCWVCPPTSAREMLGPNSRAKQGAADEPEKAQDADDEALPVTGDGERGDHHDQDEVEHISAHDPNRIVSFPVAWPSSAVTCR